MVVHMAIGSVLMAKGGEVGMRLIDADDLAAKIMIDAPDFMGGGSSITKAYILAMVKTRSATPTVDAILVVRCKDCKWYDERISMCDNCGLPREQTFFCADGEREGN